MTRPNALCFGDELPGTGVPCRLELMTEGLAVHLPESPAEEVSFSKLSFDAGGFEHDHLVLRWGEPGAKREAYVRDVALIAAIRRAVPPSAAQAIELTASQVRQARRTRRTVLLATGAGLVGLLAALWLGFDHLVGLAVDQIPVEWERAMGEAARREVLAGQRVVKDHPSVAAVEEITRRLVEALPPHPYQIEVTVVRNEAINALALPGGQVVVFTGLLTRARGPEEVAGVLSHELSHVLLRHGLTRVVKSAGLLTVVTILAGSAEGLGGVIHRLGLELLTLRFSRQQETEADVNGVRVLSAARIPVDGLIAFFDRMAEDEHVGSEWFSTHPMSAARVARLRAEAAQLAAQPSQPFSFDWAAVTAELPAS